MYDILYSHINCGWLNIILSIYKASMYIKEGQNNQRFALYVELQARGAKLCGDE